MSPRRARAVRWLLLLGVIIGAAVVVVLLGRSGSGGSRFQHHLGFESGTFDGWNFAGVGEAVPSVQESVTHLGADAARFNLAGSAVRSEISLGGDGTARPEGIFFAAGTTVVWREWFLVPVDGMAYGRGGAHNTIWQLHGEGSVGTALSLELNAEAEGTGLYVNDTPTREGPRKTFVGEVAEGRWHQFEIEFLVAPGDSPTGSYRLSLDGGPVREVTDVYTTEGTSRSAYVKTGIYRGVTGNSELYVDDIEYGTS